MKIRLICLAAGNSRRFGSNKLLYELNGRPMYLHLLERLMYICGRTRDCQEKLEIQVIVVTQYSEIYEECVKRNVRVVFSPESKRGASYSIRAGLAAAEGEGAEFCVFFAADQPFLKKETIEGFLKAMLEQEAQLGCVCCHGHNGNPVWFSRKYFPELHLLENDEGGRKVLRRHEEAVCRFEVRAEGELKDIDAAEDIRDNRLKEKQPGKSGLKN